MVLGLVKFVNLSFKALDELVIHRTILVRVFWGGMMGRFIQDIKDSI